MNKERKMNFKEFLEKRLITANELSKVIGVSHGAAWQWTQGTKPSMPSMRKLVAYFGEEVLDCFKEE